MGSVNFALKSGNETLPVGNYPTTLNCFNVSISVGPAPRSNGTGGGQDANPVIPDRGGSGISYGDPHIITPDGYFYSFMAVGEYILSDSLIAGDDFEVQARFRPFDNGLWSANDAVAMNVHGDIVEIYAQNSLKPRIIINGDTQSLGNTGTFALPNGGAVSYRNGETSVGWIDKTSVTVSLGEDIMGSLDVHLTDRRRGKVEGLLGDFDGDSQNDLKIRNGDVLESYDLDVIYSTFRESWRVKNRLFTFGADPYDPNYPNEFLTLDELRARDAELVAWAEGECRKAGILDAEVFNACVFDVAISEDSSWAGIGIGVDPSNVRVSITPSTALFAVGGQLAFTADVSGTSDQKVTWEATGGEITVTDVNTMLYKATSAGDFTITATSNDSSRVRSVTVSVIELGGFPISGTIQNYNLGVQDIDGAVLVKDGNDFESVVIAKDKVNVNGGFSIDLPKELGDNFLEELSSIFSSCGAGMNISPEDVLANWISFEVGAGVSSVGILLESAVNPQNNTPYAAVSWMYSDENASVAGTCEEELFSGSFSNFSLSKGWNSVVIKGIYDADIDGLKGGTIEVAPIPQNVAWYLQEE